MPYGTPPLARELEHGRLNRFLATLPPHDFSLLAPHLRTIPLERGVMLHAVGEEFETATIGRAGVIGASAGLGAKQSGGRAIVQLPGTGAWISACQFHAAANRSQRIRDLIVRYNDLLLAQVQQSVV